jgi:hypothetical protein
MGGWFIDDPWRTVILAAVILLALNALREFRRSRAVRPVEAQQSDSAVKPVEAQQSDSAVKPLAAQQSDSAVRPWMLFGTGGWSLLVITVAIVTNVVPGARICDESTVGTPAKVQEEVSSPSTDQAAAPGTGQVSTKRTTTSSGTETTSECSGLSVAQAALLLAPGLLFLAPALSNLDVTGLFSLSFREVQRKLDEQKNVVDSVAADVASVKQTQETIVRLGLTINVSQNVGRAVREGQQQAREGDTVDFSQVFGDLDDLQNSAPATAESDGTPDQVAPPSHDEGRGSEP